MQNRELGRLERILDCCGKDGWITSHRLPRMISWLIASALLAVPVLILAPHQLPVILHKVLLLTIAAWIGYWVDRCASPYARPHELRDLLPKNCADCNYAFPAAMLRRAVIIGCAMIAVSIGL